MGLTRRTGGLARYVAARWPRYLLMYGGGAAAAVIFAWFSLIRGWSGFVLLSLVCLIAIVYATGASAWAASKLYDDDRVRNTLFDLGALRPSDTLVFLNAGPADAALAYAQPLTSGRLISIDIYNPQLMQARHLARARQQAPRPAPDPRISWRDGAIDLLPFPDGSVQFIVLDEALFALWQPGDRRKLLAECRRILAIGGKLLLAERVRTSVNALISGPAVLRLPTVGSVDQLLVGVGLSRRRMQSLDDLIWCACYERPVPSQGSQLPLGLGIRDQAG